MTSSMSVTTSRAAMGYTSMRDSTVQDRRTRGWTSKLGRLVPQSTSAIRVASGRLRLRWAATISLFEGERCLAQVGQRPGVREIGFES